MTEKQPEMAPDPDEDDLNDLDDVLDEFEKKPTEPVKPKPTVSGPGRPEENEEDFAKTLEAGMKGLIGELDANPEMQQEFERMMQELIAAGSAPTEEQAAKHIDNAAEAVSSGKEKETFNDTTRKILERMQASGEQASAAAAAGGSSEEDLLAQLMQGLGGGAGGEEDFNKMLMGMMAQLTHKEILYEPMKELHDKFPAWIETHKADTPAAEMTRYKEQQTLVGEIVARFEKSGYSDDNTQDRDYIVDKMQQMQSKGSPPPDLVGDMNAAQEALGELEGGCPTQ